MVVAFAGPDEATDKELDCVLSLLEWLRCWLKLGFETFVFGKALVLFDRPGTLVFLTCFLESGGVVVWDTPNGAVGMADFPRLRLLEAGFCGAFSASGMS